VAGWNQYVNCTFADQRSWDLGSDNALDFLVNYCDCGTWSNSACATGGCSPLQRQQTRICTPANCLAQSQCVADATCCICGAWSDDYCGKGGCPANQMHQTRTCNVAGCGTESQCVASAVCPRTLTVSVTAAPVSAQAPLTTAITGTVGGTAIGTINYTTWWNCDNACATVAACAAACGAWDDKADGVAAASRTLNHTYAASGTFHPKMIVERHSLVASGTVAVTAINAAPTASALIKQTDYCGSGLATMFSWNYSDPENDPQTFRQVQVDNNADFSSPADDTGKVATASTSYVTLATKLDYDITYHWRVKVWDSWGNDSGWVNGPNFSTPLHSYPMVDFDFIPSPVKATEVITYSDRTQVFGGATISSRSWEIEGANPDTSSAENPVVTYDVKGDYTTKLTVTDSNGYTCSLEEDINVKSSLPDWEEL
jgi:PKD repeat protein